MLLEEMYTQLTHCTPDLAFPGKRGIFTQIMIGILYRNEGRLGPNSLKSFVQTLPLFKRDGLIMHAMDNEKRGCIRVDMCQGLASRISSPRSWTVPPNN